MRRPDRREFLGLLAAGGATFTVIGGVLATGSSTGAEVDGADIETTDAGCGSPASESASVELLADALEITGSLSAANPCHEASVVDLAWGDDSVTITIDTVSTLEDDEVCVECVGEISYRATVSMEDESVPATVIVDHVDGEQYEFDSFE